MQMHDENGQSIRNDSSVSLVESKSFLVYCEARGGRPKPNVAWHLNGKRLTGAFTQPPNPFIFVICGAVLLFFFTIIIFPAEIPVEK